MKYNEFDNPREKPIVQPQTTMTTKDIGDRVEKAKARAFKKPEPFDFSKLWSKEKDVTEYRNVATPRDEAHYREMMKALQDMALDPTTRTDSDLMGEIRRRKMELRNWAEKNLGEGFIGKKMEYNDFLQNKLDTAIQEYDTPEKKAERDALMKKYLSKGGTIEKVPAGQKAFVGKKIKPAYKKDNGTPITSPGSDESAVKESPIEQDHNNPIAKPYVDMPEWKALHDMDDKIVQAYIKHKEIKEDAPFGDGMALIRMALMRKFITADEWFHLKDEFKRAGEEVEQRYNDWPEGEGFGSSDGNFAIKELMGAAGYEFDEQDRTGRFVVTKVPEKLEKLGIKNARMKGEPVATEDRDEYAPARVLGAAEAGLEYGLELATHVGKKDYGMAEQVASVIRQNWPALIDKIKNIYKTEQNQDGLQPVDLKRLGQSEPKIYVHKAGKTIMIPKRKHNEYIAKGWKQSSLRAEASYESKLAEKLNQRLK